MEIAVENNYATSLICHCQIKLTDYFGQSIKLSLFLFFGQEQIIVKVVDNL